MSSQSSQDNKRQLSKGSDIDSEVYNTPKQARLKSPLPDDASNKLDQILVSLQDLTVEVNGNTATPRELCSKNTRLELEQKE